MHGPSLQCHAAVALTLWQHAKPYHVLEHQCLALVSPAGAQQRNDAGVMVSSQHCQLIFKTCTVWQWSQGRLWM